MEKRDIFGLVLSILVLVVRGSCEDYDYFQIVLQWQPATCSDAKRKPDCSQTPAQRFSIHGVWPSLYSGQILQCTGSPFDKTKIDTIRAGLNENWPDVITRQNQAFWSYEWSKHGTCSEDYFSEQQYFTLGLNAYALHDLIFSLSEYNIRPNGGTYTRIQVETAISRATGKTPALRCNTNDRTGATQLHEISLCYTRNGATRENCPPNANKCPPFFSWNP